MVGLEVLDVLCAPSSARLNETHDAHTKGGTGLQNIYLAMYKTPAGVSNSVAHHLEHPHNEGGFISREQNLYRDF